MSYDDLDLEGKLIAQQFALFQKSTTMLVLKSYLSGSDQKRKLLLYMYGVLDGFQQKWNFMRDELTTENEKQKFLSFKVGLLNTIYINSMVDGVIEVKYGSKEIIEMFSAVDSRLLPDHEFKIVVDGGNTAYDFIGISDEKDLEGVSFRLFNLLVL